MKMDEATSSLLKSPRITRMFTDILGEDHDGKRDQDLGQARTQIKDKSPRITRMFTNYGASYRWLVFPRMNTDLHG
jgi:hypothetical protein